LELWAFQVKLKPKSLGGYFLPLIIKKGCAMELIIFIVLVSVSLALIITSSYFPDYRGITLIGCTSLILIGVLLLGYGISINGVVALKNTFTQGVGVMLTIFGLSSGILRVIKKKKKMVVENGKNGKTK